EGQRSLTEKSIPKVAAAFELEGREVGFFAGLVRFNQAKNIAAKDAAYEALKTLRSDLALQRLEHSQFNYFEHWYSVAIRELVGVRGFKEDPDWIAAALRHQVTAAQVKRSLRLLEKLGLLHRDAEGFLQPKQPVLSSGDEVSSLAAYRFHQAMIEKARQALREVPSSERDISSVTLAVTSEHAEAIKSKIRQFRKEVLAMSEDSGKADAVYQMNVQFFNLSEPV
ncbi:MAG TPA: hypothetical protein DF383_02325, partial [Deltaproteobacteria bacterium]|nr:hypothetical protein [Deltaproteobacteria bacterium]